MSHGEQDEPYDEVDACSDCGAHHDPNDPSACEEAACAPTCPLPHEHALASVR